MSSGPPFPEPRKSLCHLGGEGVPDRRRARESGLRGSPAARCGCLPRRCCERPRPVSAARLDFTLDEIEDLRIAVDEACAILLQQAVPGSVLSCVFRLVDDSLEVTVSAPTTDGRAPERDTFAWTVLSALAGSSRLHGRGRPCGQHQPLQTARRGPRAGVSDGNGDGPVRDETIRSGVVRPAGIPEQQARPHPVDGADGPEGFDVAVEQQSQAERAGQYERARHHDPHDRSGAGPCSSSCGSCPTVPRRRPSCATGWCGCICRWWSIWPAGSAIAASRWTT